MTQYDDVFKLIIVNHEEHCNIVKPEEQANEEDRFEDVDQRVFIFKQKVRNWLNNAEDEYDKKSKSSRRSSKCRSLKESTRPSRTSKASSSRSSETDSFKSKVSSKAKAIEEKVKIVEFLAEAEFMEKRRMIEMEACRLHIQEKVAKSQAKFKIYQDLDQILQKAGKIEKQEDKGNSERQLKHAKTVADKTNYFNKNQQVPVSFLDRPNRKAVDDKGKKSDLIKSKYEGFDARCMEIKSGSRDFGNPGHQLIFADPEQTDAKDVSKSSNDENRSARNNGFSADDPTKVLFQLLKQQAAPNVETDTFDRNPLNYFYFMELFKEAIEKKTDQIYKWGS